MCLRFLVKAPGIPFKVRQVQAEIAVTDTNQAWRAQTVATTNDTTTVETTDETAEVL